MDKKTSVSVDIWTLLDVCNITVVQPNPSTDIVGTVEYVSNNHTGCSVSIVEFIMERLPIRQVTLYVYIHIKWGQNYSRLILIVNDTKQASKGFFQLTSKPIHHFDRQLSRISATLGDGLK